MHSFKPRLFSSKKTYRRIGHDTLITISLLLLGTLLVWFMEHVTENIMNISFIYILAVLLIARFTTSYVYGIISSVISIVCINFFFTYPYMRINFTLSGYPIAFFAMLVISTITSAATTNLKEQSRIISEREKELAAAEKEKMRANLLRAISHDLRTPLTSIIGSSNLYLENSAFLSEADKLSLIRNIHEDSNWLLNMVENILTVTRIHSENAQVTKSLEPIEEVLSEAVLRLKKRFPDAVIRVQAPDDFLMIPMDAILIEQVIINLLENAIVHSKSEKPIDCYVTYDDAAVTFHVRDYGVGIPEEKLPAIFDGTGTAPSQNPDSSRGMGIGLSICNTIITAHNGQISAFNISNAQHSPSLLNKTKSQENVGVEFRFTLPREDRAPLMHQEEIK